LRHLAPRRVKLGTALVALLLLAVLSTALVIHLSWSWTARRNIETVVASLNTQTANAVRRELDQTFRAAEGAAEIVRSILFQGTISADDEAKREFVFLSVLRSNPAFSWVGFGFPDGRFFGAHATLDRTIEMIEIGALDGTGARALRRDIYEPIPGDIFFKQRLKATSQYEAKGAPWYRSAVSSPGQHWTMVNLLPSGFEPAAVVSTPVDVYSQFRGVLMVTLNLAKLSQFLGGLDIAKNGAAAIVTRDGQVVASSFGGKHGMGRLSALPGPLTEAMAKLFDRKEATAVLDSEAAGPVYGTAAELDFNGWQLLTAIPRAAFTAEIDRNSRRLVVFVAALAILAALVAAAFAHSLFVRPVKALATEIGFVESFQLDKVRRFSNWLAELDDLSAALKRMATGLSAFGRYIPTELVRDLIAQGVEPRPGGELREITVMFADLPGFTTLAEKYGPDVEPYLTGFLTIATEAIARNGGTVDKFIGDAVMAFWNAPREVPDHAPCAARAAHVIRTAMRTLPRPGGMVGGPVVRIGLNTGTAMVGNIGSADRLSYTAIGDTVNIASRIEGLAKEYGIEIMLSETTAEHLGRNFALRPVGETSIRGRSGMIRTFELQDIFDPTIPSQLEHPGEDTAQDEGGHLLSNVGSQR
jgi:class 3 adenylate cyclase